MSKERIAGRSLDFDVAVALGWRSLAETHRFVTVGKTPHGPHGVRGTIVRVPPYSTDNAAALSILTLANENRAFASVCNTPDGTWVAQLGAFDPVEARTFALAVSLAAIGSAPAFVPLDILAASASSQCPSDNSVSRSLPDTPRE